MSGSSLMRVTAAVAAAILWTAPATASDLARAVEEAIGVPDRPQPARPAGEVQDTGAIVIRVVVGAEKTPVRAATVVVAHAEKSLLRYSADEDVQIWASTPPAPGQEMSWDRDQQARYQGRGETKKSGQVRLKALAPGPYNLIAYHERHGAAIIRKVTLSPDRGPMEVILQPAGFLAGTIKGLPVRTDNTMAMLSLHSPSQSDPQGDRVTFSVRLPLGSDGRYKSAALPIGGKATLMLAQLVEDKGFWATLANVPLEVAAGRTTQFDLDLTAGLRIEGRVLGPQGKPLSDVSITVAPKKDPQRQFGAVTDADGKYMVAGMVEADYVLEARRWGRRTKPG